MSSVGLGNAGLHFDCHREELEQLMELVISEQSKIPSPTSERSQHHIRPQVTETVQEVHVEDVVHETKYL